LYDLALGDERSAGDTILFVVADFVVPDDAAGFDVEGDEVRVGSGNEERAGVDREVPLEVPFDAGTVAFGKLACIVPEQITGGGVERLHTVAKAVNEDNAIVNQRRVFVGPVGQRPGPGDTEGGDVGAIDLLERAEAEVVVGSSPGEPFASRWIL
jgi:hypothetical protein